MKKRMSKIEFIKLAQHLHQRDDLRVNKIERDPKRPTRMRASITVRAARSRRPTTGYTYGRSVLAIAKKMPGVATYIEEWEAARARHREEELEARVAKVEALRLQEIELDAQRKVGMAYAERASQ